MKKKTNGMFVPLTKQEMAEINGGNPGLTLALLGLMYSMWTFGYQMGKDRAEADRRAEQK